VIPKFGWTWTGQNSARADFETDLDQFLYESTRRPGAYSSVTVVLFGAYVLSNRIQRVPALWDRRLQFPTAGLFGECNLSIFITVAYKNCLVCVFSSPLDYFGEGILLLIFIAVYMNCPVCIFLTVGQFDECIFVVLAQNCCQHDHLTFYDFGITILYVFLLGSVNYITLFSIVFISHRNNASVCITRPTFKKKITRLNMASPETLKQRRVAFASHEMEEERVNLIDAITTLTD
jgi:hypothetical protein